jgi:hypothetical protein
MTMDSLGVSTRLCAGIEFESSCMSLLNRSSDGLQMSDVDTIYLNNLRQVLDHVERSVNRLSVTVYKTTDGVVLT